MSIEYEPEDASPCESSTGSSQVLLPDSSDKFYLLKVPRVPLDERERARGDT